MPDVATTWRQRKIMRHAIGLDMSAKPFRNYYCAVIGGHDDEMITQLVELGLMTKDEPINGGREYYAHVTEEGKKEVMTW